MPISNPSTGSGMWEELDGTELDGATSSVSYTSLPTGYVAFKILIFSGNGTAGSTYIQMNNDTGAGSYNTEYIRGITNTASSADVSQTYWYIGDQSSAGNIDYAWEGIIFNTTRTVQKPYKGVGGWDDRIYSTSGRWDGTAEINRIDITFPGNCVQYSRIIIMGLVI